MPSRERRMRGSGILRRRAEADPAAGRGLQDPVRDLRGGARAPAAGQPAPRHRGGAFAHPGDEAGTLYAPQEIRRLAELAHAHDMLVHVDAARFANALARQKLAPAEASWKLGVDVLSFGATKGGAL